MPDTSEWTEAQHRATWAVLDVLKRRGTTVTVQAAIDVVDAVTGKLAGPTLPLGIELPLARAVRLTFGEARRAGVTLPLLEALLGQVDRVEATAAADAAAVQRARELLAYWRQVKSPNAQQAANDLEAALDDVGPSRCCQRCGVGIAPGVDVEHPGPLRAGVVHSDLTVCRHYGWRPVTGDTPPG
jgi:hypothetical protein